LSIYLNGRWNDDIFSVPVKSVEVRRPDRVFTFIDEEEGLLTSGVFVLKAGNEVLWWTVPGARDRRTGANVAFADGHAGFHKWNYPQRIRKGYETPIVNAPDREDLRWLLSRVPGSR
jgi:prepilin-type processing-associated H-X9-DG protein